MRSPFKLLTGFALAALLGLMLWSPVAAQDDEESGAIDPSTYEGLQRAINRVYTPDFSAMVDGASTPGADAEAAMEDMPDIIYLTVAVFEFDGDDNAEGGFDKLYDDSKNSLFGDDMQGYDIQEEDVDDFGDEAKSVTISGGPEGEEEYGYGLIVREGSIVHFMIAGGAESVPTDSVKSVAQAMLDAEPGDGDGSYVEDGTSTGGLWDVLPAAGHESLGGITPTTDYVIYPVEGTPDVEG